MTAAAEVVRSARPGASDRPWSWMAEFTITLFPPRFTRRTKAAQVAGSELPQECFLLGGRQGLRELPATGPTHPPSSEVTPTSVILGIDDHTRGGGGEKSHRSGIDEPAGRSC